MIALVTGATGCVGYALARRLVLSGEYDEVRALVRPGRENALPPDVRAFWLDNINALEDATRRVDTVFHCAAKVHDADGDSEEFYRVNLDGTQNLMNACSLHTNPPPFVFFSTVAVYGDDTPPEGLPENAPIHPQTPYANSKVAAEGRVCQWGRENKAPVYVLRVATVYGPRDRGNLGRMMKAIAKNRFFMMGDGQNRKTCASVENVAAAAIAISRQNNFADGTPIIVADPTPVTLRELREAMQSALCKAGWKKSLSRLSLPVPVALALSAGVTGAARLACRNSPLTPAQVKRIAADNVYQTDRLNTIIGYFPPSTLSQGMLDAAKWLISEGQIR